QSKRGFVEKIDFYTSFGHGTGGNDRENIGLTTKGPTILITDLAIWAPDPITKEFTVTSLHPGVTKDMMADTVGWEIKYAETTNVTPAPTSNELSILRDLKERTRKAHTETSVP
ncbi:MAG: CoA-transferase subunit beta, partial [Pseudomonadota bacterium]